MGQGEGRGMQCGASVLEGAGNGTKRREHSERAGKIIRKDEEEKKGLMMTLDREKTNWTEKKNHLTGGTRAEREKLWAGKKCKEQFTGGMTGRRHGLDFGRG